MKRCIHYTIDCEQEERGCKGCAYCNDDLNYYIDNNYNEVEIINNKIEEIRATETYGTGAYKITL